MSKLNLTSLPEQARDALAPFLSGLLEAQQDHPPRVRHGDRGGGEFAVGIHRFHGTVRGPMLVDERAEVVGEFFEARRDREALAQAEDPGIDQHGRRGGRGRVALDDGEACSREPWIDAEYPHGSMVGVLWRCCAE